MLQLVLVGWLYAWYSHAQVHIYVKNYSNLLYGKTGTSIWGQNPSGIDHYVISTGNVVIDIDFGWKMENAKNNYAQGLNWTCFSLKKYNFTNFTNSHSNGLILTPESPIGTPDLVDMDEHVSSDQSHAYRSWSGGSHKMAEGAIYKGFNLSAFEGNDERGWRHWSEGASPAFPGDSLFNNVHFICRPSLFEYRSDH